MSMPTFPEINPDLTCEQALNMILISIAMEELALSHIMNAEGEKIQYVLKTLESRRCQADNFDDVLAVNQSVTRLLDSISQNQMLLNNKMDKAVQALIERCGKEQPKPCSPNNSNKCVAVFKGAYCKDAWQCCTLFPWSIEHVCGRCVHWNACDRAKIELPAKKKFMINLTANVKAKAQCDCEIVMALQLVGPNRSVDLFTYHGETTEASKINTVSIGGVIVDTTNYSCSSYLQLKLLSPEILLVEKATLTIVEL